MWFFRRRWSKLKSKWEDYYWIFFHNDHTKSQYYLVDTLFEPVYYFVERLAKSAGPILVLIVVTLTSSVVFNYYYFIYPWNHARWSGGWAAVNFAVSLWLLVNIAFNYFMATTTRPGKPPPKVDSPVSICKNCVSPKPPRAHHCGVCRQCVLKMDHHCPWLNNCVGHYNHRYFYLFCLYMTLGTLFVSLSSYAQLRTYLTGSPVSFLSSVVSAALSFFWTTAAEENEVTTPTAAVVLKTAMAIPADASDARFWVMYEFFLCASVTLGLGGLLAWHSYLITKGETSIEKHINLREEGRHRALGSVYANPYDFGPLENWKVLFGIERGTGRSWRHVLLPSTHAPTGDGSSWRTIRSKLN